MMQTIGTMRKLRGGRAFGGTARSAKAAIAADVAWPMSEVVAKAARLVAVVIAPLVLGACSLLDAPADRPPPPAVRELPPPTPRTDGAIYQGGLEKEYFADLKARHVGDILTIRLTETTSATKSATTKTSKTSTLANTGPTLFGKTFTNNGVPILTASLDGKSSFDGEGSSAQSNTLAGSISVTVVGVETNGNMLVEGQKELHLNQGDEYVKIAGMVRPADLAFDNTITSDKIADARIGYSGRGAVDSSNRMGWLSRFFNSPIMPF